MSPHPSSEGTDSLPTREGEPSAALAPDATRRDADSLLSVAHEVHGCAQSSALAERAILLQERLQAIIDWADFAAVNRVVFDHHGVRNLDGPIFDEARAALLTTLGQGERDTSSPNDPPREASEPTPTRPTS